MLKFNNYIEFYLVYMTISDKTLMNGIIEHKIETQKININLLMFVMMKH